MEHMKPGKLIEHPVPNCAEPWLRPQGDHVLVREAEVISRARGVVEAERRDAAIDVYPRIHQGAAKLLLCGLPSTGHDRYALLRLGAQRVEACQDSCLE